MLHYNSSYDWGVGLTPGKDDVVRFRTLSSYDKQSCVHVQLEHNVTYFSTVVANNKALNQKSANASSDGREFYYGDDVDGDNDDDDYVGVSGYIHANTNANTDAHIDT